MLIDADGAAGLLNKTAEWSDDGCDPGKIDALFPIELARPVIELLGVMAADDDDEDEPIGT